MIDAHLPPVILLSDLCNYTLSAQECYEQYHLDDPVLDAWIRRHYASQDQPTTKRS